MENVSYKKSIGTIALSAALSLALHGASIRSRRNKHILRKPKLCLQGLRAGRIASSRLRQMPAFAERKGILAIEVVDVTLENKTAKGTRYHTETKEDSKDHPNIIVLQMESFTVAEDYSNMESQLRIRHRCSINYISRIFIRSFEVQACGAGTANTEFEVLTGISAKFFGPGKEYPYKGKLREETLENQVYIAKSHGYRNQCTS